MVFHPSAQTDEHVSDERVALRRPAIMDPFTVASRLDEPGTSEMTQMPGDLRLDHTQGIGQFADAGLAAREQIEQTQPGRVGQRLEQKRRRAVFLRSFHSAHIYG